jgi:hypothetical protein
MKSLVPSLVFWFELTMILTSYLGVVFLLAGKGLDWLEIILFIWMMIYLIIKILSFYQSVKNK